MLHRRLAMPLEECLGARDEGACIFGVVLVEPATHHVSVPLGREISQQRVISLHNVSQAQANTLVLLVTGFGLLKHLYVEFKQPKRWKILSEIFKLYEAPYRDHVRPRPRT
jgi:hypothetical protein